MVQKEKKKIRKERPNLKKKHQVTYKLGLKWVCPSHMIVNPVTHHSWIM